VAVIGLVSVAAVIVHRSGWRGAHLH